MSGGEAGRELLKHLSNLVNALIALAPSRNYITQFLYLIRINYAGEAKGISFRILENAYPEIVKDDQTREKISKVFGVNFKEKVTLADKGFGDNLTNFLSIVLTFFASDEFRRELSSLLKVEFPQGVPDLLEEWVSVRLKGLSSEPTLGGIAIRALKELVKRGSATVEDLKKALSVEEWDLVDALTLCRLYGLVRFDSRGYYVSDDSLKKYSYLLEKL
ncbi:MAG: hypothetical protein LM580_12875 [Thermofilum sp.]|nr:hypothetical protein [Thermofilum sp.]